MINKIFGSVIGLIMMFSACADTLGGFVSSAVPATTTKSGAGNVVWTAVFSDAQPNRAGITKDYCLSHTPTVMVTTIDQISSPVGVMALNQVNVRYLSYTTNEVNGLYFNVVKATISGVDNQGNKWSEPMSLYEQTLSPTGVTDTVWSTPSCKGKFVGTATILQ
jgi:hypothetical protein